MEEEIRVLKDKRSVALTYPYSALKKKATKQVSMKVGQASLGAQAHNNRLQTLSGRNRVGGVKSTGGVMVNRSLETSPNKKHGGPSQQNKLSKTEKLKRVRMWLDSSEDIEFMNDHRLELNDMEVSCNPCFRRKAMKKETRNVYDDRQPEIPPLVTKSTPRCKKAPRAEKVMPTTSRA